MNDLAGILNIDKPAGMTSHDVVNRVRRTASTIPVPDLAGILNIDKSAGMTSHDVVNRVRRTASTRRVGHAGTLDPLVGMCKEAIRQQEENTA